MHAFRLCRHDRTPLDGAGGLHADGRWHQIGSRIVYAASSLSLAVLETRVHHDSAPRGWVVLELSIPDRLIETYDVASLPVDWANHRAITQRRGEDWLRSARSAVLSVPSVIVRSERNYLLNPLHPEAAAVLTKPARPFEFDARLFRGPQA